MFNQQYIADFVDAIEDTANDETVLQMKQIPQHVAGISCYDHCLYVAYVSFVLCQHLGLNSEVAARGAMLHDLYLTHWEQTNIGMFKRLLIHPKLALQNALKLGVSDLEKDIIVKHMWPLTPVPPKHAEGFVVSLADKICATSEFLGFPGAMFLLKRVETQMELKNI